MTIEASRKARGLVALALGRAHALVHTQPVLLVRPVAPLLVEPAGYPHCLLPHHHALFLLGVRVHRPLLSRAALRQEPARWAAASLSSSQSPLAAASEEVRNGGKHAHGGGAG